MAERHHHRHWLWPQLHSRHRLAWVQLQGQAPLKTPAPLKNQALLKTLALQALQALQALAQPRRLWG